MSKAYKVILGEQFDKLGIPYTFIAFGEVEVAPGINNEQIIKLSEALNVYGIDLIESQKNILIQKIKDAIIELVYRDEKLPNSKVSSYLAKKLNHSYGYLSNLFSELTFSSIENYIIIQKIERAKQLITTEEITFSEIAWRLNYSSVAHFSAQFKNVTGLTPTAFQRIIKKRREISKAD